MRKETRYYTERLSAGRLRAVYEVAPPRARRYLEAEIDFVARSAPPARRILELGCGYGRVMRRIASAGRELFGIDTSPESLHLARSFLGRESGAHLACMDATRLGFPDRSFDLVYCVQNGIAAFRVDPSALVEEASRVTRPGGRILFSSYADGFWEGRLAWFREQAAHGLIGEIDEEATGGGVIVCKDGLRLARVGPDGLRALTPRSAQPPRIVTVDESSVFATWVIT
jgi:2-polyprenyl-6-hydroxyphenyl methylase/3-demethylubiquinone-9 3-methyltransferase